MGLLSSLRGRLAQALSTESSPVLAAAEPLEKQAAPSPRGSRASALTAELGSPGLKRYGGVLDEEFLPALKGEKAIRTYREMSDNDPTVGAVLFVIEMLIRQAAWDVEPASEDAADKEHAEFLSGCMHDLDQPWTEFIAEVLTMLVFGFSLHEIVYKIRRGQAGKTPSDFGDGKIGWAKLPGRAQDTVDHWLYADDSNELLGVQQVDPVTFRTIDLPIEKLIHFRTTLRKGSPEGRSILRNAYRPWFFVRRLEEIEAIGIERDMAGLPVAHVPPTLLADDAAPHEKALLEQIKRIVTGIKRNEQMGVVFPLEYDDQGNVRYKLELMSSFGSKPTNPNEAIQRKRQEIAMTVLADFILLGHEKVGSFALASSKTDLFGVALGAWLDSIAETLNQQAVPRLFALNGVTGVKLPEITHGDIETPDLGELGEYVLKLANAGALTVPDDKLERHLRRVADLPERDEEEGGE